MLRRITQIIIGIILFNPLINLNAQDIEKLSVKGYHASFVDGNKVVYSQNNYRGLYLFDIDKNSSLVLSEEQKSGKDVFVNMGKIYFSINQGIVDSDLEGNKNIIIQKDLDLNSKEAAIIHVNNLAVDKELKVLFVKPVNKLKELEIHYNNGQTKIINPINKKGVRYLTSEVAPDGKTVLIKQYGANAYLINLQGEIVSDLGYMERPKWYGSNSVVFQLTKDDGHVINKSDIYKVDIQSNKRVNLTSNFNQLALEPATNSTGNKIIFHTGEGDLYIINE